MAEKTNSLPQELRADVHVTRARQLLFAIVENSDDAILTKDLNGIITSWNGGAERLFGYTAEEVVGEPVTILIPADRQDEEPRILAKIRAGERVHHYETIRQRKDGSLIDISLSVSPLRDEHGTIIGASKIARDITDWRRAHERQTQLLREMQHRVKNVFALASSLITLSAPKAKSANDLAEITRSRLSALARAHSLTVANIDQRGEAIDQPTSFRALLKVLVAPHIGTGDERLTFRGADFLVSPRAVTPLALVVNELVTNASKYGALRQDDGTIEVECTSAEGQLTIKWIETGSEPIASTTIQPGFGTRLSEVTVTSQLSGSLSREWTPNGLIATLTLDPSRL